MLYIQIARFSAEVIWQRKFLQGAPNPRPASESGPTGVHIRSCSLADLDQGGPFSLADLDRAGG